MHLSEEQLVLHHYHDDDQPSVAAEHLRTCAECRAQYETLRRILAVVSEAPVPERDDAYPEQVWNRLRWKLGRDRRRATWQSLLAAAAVLAIAFFAGQWWQARRNAGTASIPQVAQTTTGTAAEGSGAAPSTGSPMANPERVLLVVVGDHLDDSERMLMELANADPSRSFAGHSERAAELVASNRIYRQTAAQRGEARIASLLSDIEPILLELSNAGTTLDREKLASIQKRIESRGLLFKVRVMSAQVGDEGADSAPKPNSNKL